MMSHECVVPSWNNLKQAEDGNRSSHVDYFHPHLFFPQTSSQIAPMSNYEVTELTWENGQLAMHELGGVGQAGDTLESIVHQATYCNPLNPNPNPSPIVTTLADHNLGRNMKEVGPLESNSLGKWSDNSCPIPNPAPPPPPPPSGLIKKRSHSETDHNPRLPNDHESACASANAAFCRDNNDTTMMTWASYESPRSCTRTKTTTDEDSFCQGGSFMQQGNHEEDRETKGETGRSFTTRKGRAAAVHNQSERRRRDRINQKMKALQKLVPNSSKPKQTDKASMLDEVIDYLKQLQAQVQMMSNARFMPQIMMPAAAAAAALGMQQQLQQMSLLARMGMGIGMMDTPPPNTGQTLTPPQLIHPSQVATASSGFVPPGAFVVPQIIPHANSSAGPSSSAPLQDHYATLLAQSMNMDLYNRMVALQRQQQQQTPHQPTGDQLHLNHHMSGGQGN